MQETTGLLRTLQPLTHGDKQRRIQAERLQNEFQASVSRFSEVQKVFILAKSKQNYSYVFS